MDHYICKECGGVSETPGVCTTVGCSAKNHDLEACSCNEEAHMVRHEEGEE